jgi:hypothetical protein
MIVFDPKLGVAIAEAAKASYNPFCDQALANVIGDQNLGGFIFSDYTGVGGSMMTHVAGLRRGWLTRELLFDAANYCFNHSKCERIFGQVPETKPKVLAFDLKMGWKEEAFLEGVFPDGGCHIVSMTRAGCRWLDWQKRLGGTKANG